MIRFLTVILFVLVSFTAAAQPVTLRTVCDLPSILKESSGLEITGGYTLWSHNDSGGEPELYLFDTTGAYHRSLRIGNASNVDWEDIAQDDAGNVYIGDFGNNANNRRNLRIYKIPNPLAISSSVTNAEIISFAYADQAEFPPPNNRLDYDMEAMFWHADALYLITKNRTQPFDGMVYVYKVPDSAGTYTVSRIDSFYTGPGAMLENWVTAADISPDGSRLVLLAQGKAWLFSGFEADRFFDGDAALLEFPGITQKEAVCFASATELYITDELVGGIIGGKLYMLDIGGLTDTDALPAPEGHILHTWPNPFGNAFTVSVRGAGEGYVSLYSTLGTCVYRKPLGISHDGVRTLRLSPAYSAVPPGMYVAVLQTARELKIRRIVRE